MRSILNLAFSVCLAMVFFYLGVVYHGWAQPSGVQFVFALEQTGEFDDPGLGKLEEVVNYFVDVERWHEASCLSLLQAAIAGDYVEEMATMMLLVGASQLGDENFISPDDDKILREFVVPDEPKFKL